MRHEYTDKHQKSLRRCSARNFNVAEVPKADLSRPHSGPSRQWAEPVDTLTRVRIEED